jgi:glycosyltransferase involved in cell wall biosynthesis
MERKQKRIIISRNNTPASILTVWLGVYNGSQYINSLATQLMKQTYTDFSLLVVDNASTDDSWEKLQDWLLLFDGKITLIKNPINMGLYGSLVLNRDHIMSEWLLPMHQDDYYLKNHVLTHLNQINRANSEVVAISTDMASMNNEGKKLITLPRGSWFPAGDDAPSRFIQNLISIVVPQPSTSFKTEEFFDSMGPWHDSWSFCDVELTLKMIAKGDFIQVKKQTMRYRENPMSASHVIQDDERKIGAVIGLTRVFASQEFVKIAKQVEPRDREAFTAAIRHGIKTRVGESDFYEFICLIAMESLSFTWGYESNGPLNNISKQYANLNFIQVQSFLQNIIFDNGIENIQPNLGVDDNSGETDLKKLLTSKVAPKEKRHSILKKMLKVLIYHFAIRLLPYRVKRFVFEKCAILAFKVGLNHHWNFNWR